MKMLQLIIFGSMVVIVACNPSNENGEALQGEVPDGRVAVEAVISGRDILNPWIELSGVVRGEEEVVVASETEGVIQSVSVELGDRVNVGGEILRVDREEALYSMQQAHNQLVTAQRNLEVSEELVEDNTISRGEYEEALAAYHGARAGYESAKARYENTVVTAPISGLIAQKGEEVAVGNLISFGMVVAQIVNLDVMRFEGAVGEREVGLLEPGLTAYVSVPALQVDTPFTATVSAVAPRASPQSASYSVVINWQNNASSVLSGMNARARVRTTDKDSVLVVPTSAVVRQNDSTFVFLAKGVSAQRTAVRVGRRVDNLSEIAQGVTAGDTVITSRTTTLTDGDRVRVRVIGESGDLR
ncbi:efflux RND transporter periplasmic adaptor subunit [Chitinispirillales bacterium ANBcel5]|uniref:efflux RND transporter periplasmic adaptor subunit n=1 Tax=Cellulosispirillum alkaliphilum TaxID=3039283 RepID=UPI002A5919FB|nr:efflux RND transporter periplasmic adaptor subunit [Chitinispirillales bacterium ANBcel5]